MGVYEYRGEPGMGYLYLATAAGTAPHTNLTAGDVIDFGEHEPPADNRWVEPDPGVAKILRLPDNHPDAQPLVEWPESEPQDAEPAEDATPEPDPAPAETSPAEPTKRSKPAAKTTA